MTEWIVNYSYDGRAWSYAGFEHLHDAKKFVSDLRSDEKDNPKFMYFVQRCVVCSTIDFDRCDLACDMTLNLSIGANASPKEVRELLSHE